MLSPPEAATPPPDHRPAAFRPPITAIRWGAIVVGLALAGTSLATEPNLAGGAAVLVLYAAWRSLRPVPYRTDTRDLLEVLLEVVLHVLVVVGTGIWDSPFVFSLITAILVAGFTTGFGVALRAALVAAAAVALPYHQTTGEPLDVAAGRTAQWATELVLVAVAAGYARRVLGEAEERHSLALDRLQRLSEANTLLSSLHEVAQVLPASLDLDEVLDSTTASLRSFFGPSALAILLKDETSPSWMVVRQEGVRLPAFLREPALPAAVLSATRARQTLAVDALDPTTTAGLSVRSQAGLYAPLRARSQLVGVLAVEHPEGERFSAADVSLLDGFTEAAALAIDNARWFARLRTVGADEERTRIARELHDRVGQSLAYLAFEMDRLVRHGDEGELRKGVDALRADLRTVIGEVRDTLYDLRTDVSAVSGFVDTVSPFLERVRERSGIAIDFQHDSPLGRLPLPQEREMWRLLQEAVTNAERHSGASLIRVRWTCNGVKAELEIADNGGGFEIGKAGRLDSYGLLGMRERAAGIGATLSVDSAPGRGATVRCRLDAH